MKLIKINPADYGLEEKTAADISKMFKPMLDKMVELENEYNSIIKLEITPETVTAASELLNKYVKVRTGTDKIHKELKRFYLQGGRFVDGWKNAQLMASQNKEDKLQDIKNYYEIQEKQRLRELHQKRENEIRPYMDDTAIIPGSFGELNEEIWQNYLTGAKVNFEARKKAEAKAESDRIEAEKKEADRIKQLAIDNARLQKEAEAREKQRIKDDQERLRLAEIEEKERAKEIEAINEKNRIVKLQADKLAAELKTKQDAENKAEQDRLAAIETEAKKGDAAKMKDLINDLTELKTKYSFKAKTNQKLYINTGALLDKIVVYLG